MVVVEDDAGSRRSLERVLRVGGFQPVTFESAELFLASSFASEPLGLVLDHRLPGMSGLELQEHLKSQGSTLPIIVVTAHDDPSTRAEAERLGCVAYLSKPCDGRTILALLRCLARS